MGGNSEREAAGAARARAGLYELLATIFRAPLAIGTLRSLRSSEFLDALEDAGMRVDDAFRTGDEKALLTTLAVDFTQLFHGPRQHRVANESVQTGSDGGVLGGEACVAVQKFYRAVGLCYDETQPELPDHISVELTCMAALAGTEAEAREAGDQREAQRCLRHQADFLVAHPGRWVIDLGHWVASRARTPFYREAGQLLAEFLEAEIADLAESADVAELAPRAGAPTKNFTRRKPRGEHDHVRTGIV
jgi:TorA maturation chaperone TorD